MPDAVEVGTAVVGVAALAPVEFASNGIGSSADTSHRPPLAIAVSGYCTVELCARSVAVTVAVASTRTVAPSVGDPDAPVEKSVSETRSVIWTLVYGAGVTARIGVPGEV